MQSGGSYLQGYNCQLAVDRDHQVIVAMGVSNQPPDVEHLEPRLQRIAATAGALPDVMTMEAGYWSEQNLKACSDQPIDAYIATGRLPHGQPLPPKRGPLPRDAVAKTRMARKLRSKQGTAIYAKHKAIVEPANCQIKEARGLRRFLLRGLERVDGEWHSACLGTGPPNAKLEGQVAAIPGWMLRVLYLKRSSLANLYND